MTKNNKHSRAGRQPKQVEADENAHQTPANTLVTNTDTNSRGTNHTVAVAPATPTTSTLSSNDPFPADSWDECPPSLLVRLSQALSLTFSTTNTAIGIARALRVARERYAVSASAVGLDATGARLQVALEAAYGVEGEAERVAGRLGDLRRALEGPGGAEVLWDARAEEVVRVAEQLQVRSRDLEKVCAALIRATREANAAE